MNNSINTEGLFTNETKPRKRKVYVQAKDDEMNRSYTYEVDENMNDDDAKSNMYSVDKYLDLVNKEEYDKAINYLEQYHFEDIDAEGRKWSLINGLRAKQLKTRQINNLANKKGKQSVIDFYNAYQKGCLDVLRFKKSDDGKDIYMSDEEFEKTQPEAYKFITTCRKLICDSDKWDDIGDNSCYIRFPYVQHGPQIGPVSNFLKMVGISDAGVLDWMNKNDTSDYNDMLHDAGLTEEDLINSGCKVYDNENGDKIIKFDKSNNIMYKIIPNLPVSMIAGNDPELYALDKNGNRISHGNIVKEDGILPGVNEFATLVPRMLFTDESVRFTARNIYDVIGKGFIRSIGHTSETLNTKYDYNSRGQVANTQLNTIIKECNEAYSAINKEIESNISEGITISSGDMPFTNSLVEEVRYKNMLGEYEDWSKDRWGKFNNWLEDEQANIIRQIKETPFDGFDEVLSNGYNEDDESNKKVYSITTASKQDKLSNYLSSKFGDKATIKSSVDADGLLWYKITIPMPTADIIREVSSEDSKVNEEYKDFLKKQVVIKVRGGGFTESEQAAVQYRADIQAAITMQALEKYGSSKMLKDGSVIKYDNGKYKICKPDSEEYKTITNNDLEEKLFLEEGIRIGKQFKFQNIKGDNKLGDKDTYREKLIQYCALLAKQCYNADNNYTLNGMPIDLLSYILDEDDYIKPSSIDRRFYKQLQLFKNIFEAVDEDDIDYFSDEILELNDNDLLIKGKIRKR